MERRERREAGTMRRKRGGEREERRAGGAERVRRGRRKWEGGEPALGLSTGSLCEFASRTTPCLKTLHS